MAPTLPAARCARDKVIDLHRHMRYSDMAQGCNDARSSAWFNNLRNGKSVGPPSRQQSPALAKLFGVTPERVCELIADEWYGIRSEDVSARVRALGSTLDVLDEDDFKLVEALTYRLAKGV